MFPYMVAPLFTTMEIKLRKKRLQRHIITPNIMKRLKKKKIPLHSQQKSCMLQKSLPPASHMFPDAHPMSTRDLH